MFDEQELTRIEDRHTAGLTSAEILDLFAAHEVPLSEATLRKYVQLGLLPRSIRVGQKGKHQGSKGIYPVGVVRQIVKIKEMMASSLTIEQIQREFLFMRSDLQALESTLDSIFVKIDKVAGSRRRENTTQTVVRDVGEARALSKDLMARLEAIETKLTSRTRFESAQAAS